jgi:four helix bundle protein
MKTFEDLDAFQAALTLIDDVYEVTALFPQTELYGLTSQMRRAATSVAHNIAEGQGRFTPGEWRQMLSQARGSLFELQAQVIIAKRLRFLDRPNSERLRTRIGETARPLSGLINYVRRQRQSTTTENR